jgi:NADH-quinone oxidoreductase subunit L
LDAAGSGPNAHVILWLLGLAGAGLTSFYMFRLIFLTFFGKPRFDEHKVHVHESPHNMTVPLMILALLSIVGGWFAAPHLMGGPDYFQRFLAPVFSEYAPNPSSDLLQKMQEAGISAHTAGAVEYPAETLSPSMELVHALTGPPVVLAIIGLLVAWWFYIRQPDAPKKLAERAHGLYKLLLDKYYVDEIYGAVIIRPFLWISTTVLWHVIDERLIDGTVNGVATVSREVGGKAREIQSGNARSYATWVVIGAVGFTVLMLGVWGMVR